jgi:hypothetical protein
MRKEKQAALLFIGLFLSLVAAQAEQPSKLRWVVTAGHTVDKAQAETIYLEACNFVRDRYDRNGRAVCPVITVHVGKACPAGEIAGSCMNPALGVLYLPQWNEDAPKAVAKITLMTSLHWLMNPGEPMLLARLSPGNESARTILLESHP